MEMYLSKYNNPNLNLPITITPITHAVEKSLEAPRKKKPDLTFHCMCCNAFFEDPRTLYKHMNSCHPDLEDANDYNNTENTGAVPPASMEPFDYSCVMEPICQLVDYGKGKESDSNDDSNEDDEDNSSTSSSSSSSSDDSNDNEMPESRSNEEEDCTETANKNSAMDTCEEDENSINSFARLQTHLPLRNELTSCVISGRGRKSSTLTADQLSPFRNGDQKCFQCSHCDESFPNAGDLSKHVRSHISNKPFQCSICQKTFTHIGSLNTHIRIHSGEKPYKCELCPKAFTQSSSLMVHVRSHSIRKPHQCHMCDKGQLLVKTSYTL